MSGQATYAPTAAPSKRMPEDLRRVAQSPQSPDIPGDGRHGNPSSIHKVNGKITKQKLQSVKAKRFPVDASSLPCRRHEACSLVTAYVRKLILSQLNSPTRFVRAESTELIGTVREVRNNSVTRVALMCPTVKKYFPKLARYPFGKTILRVKASSMPVRYDRRRDRSSNERFQSGNNLLYFIRVNRTYVVNDNNEFPSCSNCSGIFGSIDIAHGELEIASWLPFTLYCKVTLPDEAMNSQCISARVGRFIMRSNLVAPRY